MDGMRLLREWQCLEDDRRSLILSDASRRSVLLEVVRPVLPGVVAPYFGVSEVISSHEASSSQSIANLAETGPSLLPPVLPLSSRFRRGEAPQFMQPYGRANS